MRAFLGKWSTDPLVAARMERNLAAEKPHVSRDEFWLKMLACLLTSQQRSGPDSPVTRFLSLDPFPLRVETCDGCNVEAHVGEALKRARGIRFINNITSSAVNLPLMSGAAWDACRAELEYLRVNRTIDEERRVFAFIDDRFHGFGPQAVSEPFAAARSYAVRNPDRQPRHEVDGMFRIPAAAPLGTARLPGLLRVR